MRQRTLLTVAIGLIVIGAVGVVGGAVLGRTLGPTTGDGRAGRVDAMFIEQMVPHHQDAIDMAEMALSRAEHPEIVELAERIKETQTDENERMRAWYEDWFGTPVPDAVDEGMMGGMMRGGTDMERLREADDFDREFIEQMVPHHRAAIMMSRMAGRATRRTEMRELTDSIIETQSREIEDMLRWHRQWYGDQ